MTLLLICGRIRNWKTVTHWYNEHNPYRAAVLRERMADGLIPHGEVSEMDIEKIPDEQFRRSDIDQIHLFAGIGGFPLGLRLAGFPESGVRIVTGGFPCQDISNAGLRAGISGARSGLWREMLRCIRVVRPDYVFVENVAALLAVDRKRKIIVGPAAMGTVLGDLAGIGYDTEWHCVSAEEIGAPHWRWRVFIIAYPTISRSGGLHTRSGNERKRAYISDRIRENVSNARKFRCKISRTLWDGSTSPGGICKNVSNADESRLSITKQEKIFGAGRGNEGRATTERDWWAVEPDVGRVAHGIPARVDRLAALGDAIVPQCVAEVIRRFFGEGVNDASADANSEIRSHRIKTR
jgi:DNA (cytosine-5)-methyltransferase 1